MSATLVPDVAVARDHVRGSRGPTLLVFGDYECPYTRAAYRGVRSLEAEGLSFSFAFRHFRLDVDRFRQELEAHVHLDRVEADRSSALASGATGTPTIFVDGHRYLGSSEPAELGGALTPAGEETE